MEPESGLEIFETEPGGYRLLQELVPQQTFLCCDISDNIVVLKRLEEDCLHRQQLHPSIKDRLAKVRELAHPRIATLRTVERWQGSACLVWTYLDGETWDDAIRKSGQFLPELFSALAASVDALHETGIVHGSLHGRNIIVRPDRQTWLTHVSPYLYADPQADVAAVVELFRRTQEHFPAQTADRVAKLLGDVEAGQISLREFSHAVLAVEETRGHEAEATTEKDASHRLISIATAVIVLAFAVAIWAGIHAIITKSESPAPATFPSLMQHASQ